MRPEAVRKAPEGFGMKNLGIGFVVGAVLALTATYLYNNEAFQKHEATVFKGELTVPWK